MSEVIKKKKNVSLADVKGIKEKLVANKKLSPEQNEYVQKHKKMFGLK